MIAMSKTRVFPMWLALALVAATLAGSAFVIYRLNQARAGQAARLSKLESANRDLQTRSDALAREVEALRQGLPAPPVPHETAHPGRRPGETGGDYIAILEQLRAKLAAANASIAALELRTHELEASLEKMTAENKRLATSETDLTEKVATTNRVVEAVQKELKGRNDRLVQLEVTNKMLHQENRSISDRSARLAALLRNLDEINRQRETYLGSILRRYRDLSDQYRRLENPRENAPAPAMELSRIQSSIAMAEEDLRQIASLNAQAARVQQKLAGK